VRDIVDRWCKAEAMAGRLHGLQWIMAVSPARQQLIRCGTSSVNDDAGDDNGVSSCHFFALCCYCIVWWLVVGFSDVARCVLRSQSNWPLLIVEFVAFAVFSGFIAFSYCCSSVVMPGLGSSF
jgi:hypothetical protein